MHVPLRQDQGRFQLASVHKGVTAEEVRAATGFDYDAPAVVPTTPVPNAEALRMLRTDVAGLIAETYPAFALRTWGVERAQVGLNVAYKVFHNRLLENVSGIPDERRFRSPRPVAIWSPGGERISFMDKLKIAVTGAAGDAWAVS